MLMKRGIFPQLCVFALPKRILSYNVGCEILSPSGTAAVILLLIRDLSEKDRKF